MAILVVETFRCASGNGGSEQLAMVQDTETLKHPNVLRVLLGDISEQDEP